MTRGSGGQMLRQLRERNRKTQLNIELEAELGSGYLQRVEAGKVAKPERETLERILTALNIGYSERREVLERFGYTVKTPLPTVQEIAAALGSCHKELHEINFPAYVLDCAHRLLAYNHYAAKLLGSKTRLDNLMGYCMVKAWFDPNCGLTTLLENPGEFYTINIRALRSEMGLFGHEDWYATLLTELHQLPLFEQYWRLVGEEANFAVAARPVAQIGLKVPDSGLLHFRLFSEAFIRDARFRLIYFLPADATALRQCSQWAT